MDKLLSPLSRERRGGLSERQFAKSRKDAPGKSYRTPAQRDRDRILYSSALHRLAYVTQVTAPESGHIFHNRLSHSLKVAQVGRRNAERLRSLVRKRRITGAAADLVKALDFDAVEASCLAHDLGHPPFGHIAEEELNAAASAYLPDAFEGNAQSFRIVTRLSLRAAEDGLNLTRQTLDGLLKYPWRHWDSDPSPGRKRERKWGYYQDDTGAFGFARKGWPAEIGAELPERCLEAEIMDWADDLTYAVHDVDDFFRAGLIPLDRLAPEKREERRRFETLLAEARDADPDAFPSYSPEALADAAARAVRRAAPTEPYEHTREMRAAMRDFGSKLITEYLEAFSIADDPESGRVRLTIDDAARCEVEALNMLVWCYVVRRPGLAVVQHGQRRVVRELFQAYYKASAAGKKGDRRVFPPSARERLEATSNSSAERARVVVDLISGLTENAAIQLHQRLTGGVPAPALDATAQIG